MIWVLASPTCTPMAPRASTGAPPPPFPGPLPVISGALAAGRGVEDVVLPAQVTDLHAVRAPHIDRVLARARPRLVHQAHQGLRRRHEISVPAGADLAQLRRQRRLPRLGSI